MSEITTKSAHLSALAADAAPKTNAAALALAGMRQVARVFRAIRHRRAVVDLAGFDDRSLRDIGLTRGDVRTALAKPLAVDPSVVLTVRRVEHRARARALAIVREAAASAAKPRTDQRACCGCD